MPAAPAAYRRSVSLLAKRGCPGVGLYLQCNYMPTRTKIIRIGNSQGIRVPKALLDQAQLPEEIELSAQPGRLLVRAARRPRAGWAEAAKMMRARGHDRLQDAPTATRFDEEEWTW